MGSNHEKNGGKKSRDTLPLSCHGEYYTIINNNNNNNTLYCPQPSI